MQRLDPPALLACALLARNSGVRIACGVIRRVPAN
jgi:hypothetical protein